MKTLMTTAGLPENKRFAHWREIVCDHFMQVECRQVSDRIFDGEILTAGIADMTLSLVRGREHQSIRNASLIRRSNAAFVFIHHQLNGTWQYDQDGRRSTLNPGDSVCLDSTRPFAAMQGSDFEQVLLHVPRDIWVRRYGRTESITAQAVHYHSAMGPLVAKVLREIISVADKVAPVTARRLLDIALSLTAAALGDLVLVDGISQSSGRAALLYRVKNFIQENLRDPDLSPQKVAAAMRISGRYLQDLFHDEDLSVARWIWQMRLEQCRRDLANSLLKGKSVSEIAFDNGFNSFSHFCRRFKNAFAMTASEYRREQLSPRQGSMQAKASEYC